MAQYDEYLDGLQKAAANADLDAARAILDEVYLMNQPIIAAFKAVDAQIQSLLGSERLTPAFAERFVNQFASAPLSQLRLELSEIENPTAGLSQLVEYIKNEMSLTEAADCLNRLQTVRTQRPPVPQDPAAQFLLRHVRIIEGIPEPEREEQVAMRRQLLERAAAADSKYAQLLAQEAIKLSQTSDVFESQFSEQPTEAEVLTYINTRLCTINISANDEVQSNQVDSIEALAGINDVSLYLFTGPLLG